jgi:hypothetical protein
MNGNATWQRAIDDLLDLRNGGQVNIALIDDLLKLALCLKKLRWPTPKVREANGCVTLEFKGPHPCLRLNDCGRYVTLDDGERLVIDILAIGKARARRKRRLRWAAADRIGLA